LENYDKGAHLQPVQDNIVKKTITFNDVQIVILAGGLGTRLAARTNGQPKPMAKLVNFSLIEHQIRFCKSLGFKNFAILASHQSEVLREHIIRLAISDIEINFHVEKIPGGTAGALIEFGSKLHDTIIVIYGDTFLTVDLLDMLSCHLKDMKNQHYLGSILVHPNSHPHDSDLISIDTNNWITGISGYPHANWLNKRNLVNAALYILDNQKFCKLNYPKIGHKKIDIAKDLIPSFLEKGFKLRAVHNRWFIKDCGTPDRLDHVSNAIINGHLNAVLGDKARSVVFVDRDGCINKEVGYVTSPEKLEIFPQAIQGIKKINNNNIPVICVTNQPVIARGDTTFDELRQIHSKLDFELGTHGAFLNDLLICPHHPDRGYSGEIPELKIECNCRKPKVGMALQACNKFNINFSSSWMIGDTTTDVKFAETLGMNSILVRTGFGGTDKRELSSPDFIFDNLNEAADFIVDEYPMYIDIIKKNIKPLLDQKIILVGGQSSSGKSTFSQVLKKFFIAIGESPVCIPADGWMMPPDVRKRSKTVYDRFDITAFQEFVEFIISGKKPIYPSIKHQQSADVGNIQFPPTIHPNSKIIIEGVATSLLSTEILSDLYFVWIGTDEKITRRRFQKKYFKLGDNQMTIEKKYSKRLTDEISILNKAQKYANLQCKIS